MNNDLLKELEKQKEALDMTIDVIKKIDENQYLKSNLEKMFTPAVIVEQTPPKTEPVLIKKEEEENKRSVTIGTNSLKKEDGKPTTMISKIYTILSEAYPSYMTVEAIVDRLRKDYNIRTLPENISSQLSARLKSHEDLEKLTTMKPIRWRVKNKYITSELRNKVSMSNLKSRVFPFLKFVSADETFTLKDLREAQRIKDEINDQFLVEALSDYVNSIIEIIDQEKMIYKKRKF